MSLVKTLSARSFILPLVVAGWVGLAGSARAQMTHLESSLSAAQECPPAASNGTGAGNYVLDVFAHQIHFNVVYQNLTSAETAAHIHGPSGVCPATGAVMIALPIGTPKTGFANTTAAQEGSLLANMTYTNIHTLNNGGGEIRGQDLLSPSVGQSFCFGDGSAASCPCGNSGAAGHGCENSGTTGGAVLSASGHTSPDNVVLISSGELPTALSIFLQGSVQTAAPAIFGDGLRCVGGSLKRIGVHNASNGWAAYPVEADLSITAKSASLGDPIAPGSMRFYQTYYRDPVLTFCPSPPGGSFNVSSGVVIAW